MGLIKMNKGTNPMVKIYPKMITPTMTIKMMTPTTITPMMMIPKT